MSYILHICSWFPHKEDPQNGVFIRQHIELTQDSFQSVVICNTPKDSIHLSNPPLKVHNLYSTRSKWGKIRAAKKIFKNLLATKGKPTAIHLHVASPLGILALLAKQFFKITLIITEHWTGYRTGLFSKASFLQKLITKKVFKSANTILVVSESLKSDLLLCDLVDEDKIKVLANPIQLNKEGSHTRFESKTGAIRMLSVADFNEKNKNFRGILKAFEQASQNHSNLEWFIIGSGPDKAMFEALINTSSVKSKIHLLGRKAQSEVHNLYHHFDFLVSFSRFETFAMVPAEAITAGIPVIATKCGGPEYYVNAENGILVESDNTDKLTEAIKTLSSSFSSFDSKRLAATLPDSFKPEYFVKAITELYRLN